MTLAERWVRWSLYVVGVGVAVGSLFDVRLGTAQHWPSGTSVVGLALGAGLMLVGWGVSRPWRAFSGWSAIFLVGQAIALQLVRCGNMVRYQHLPPIQDLSMGLGAPWFQLLVLQGAICGWMLWKRRRVVAEMLSSAVGRLPLAATAVALVMTSATVSPRVVVYAGELSTAALLVSIHVATLLVAVSHVPVGRLAASIDRLTTRFAAALPSAKTRTWKLVVLAAVAVTLVGATLNLVAYQRHPHVPDEVAYLTHARFLAAGSLTQLAPPVPAAFETYLMHVDGDRWYPCPPPGWPVVLAMGVALGAPWLVNPLLAGLAVLLVHRLFEEFYEQQVALLATLLLAASPWHLFLGMSFMTHTATLVASVGAALALLRSRRSKPLGLSLLAGVLIGLVALVRPLDGVIVSTVLAPLALYVAMGSRNAVRRLGAFVVGGLLGGSVLLAYNSRMTGDPLRFPIQEYLDQRFSPNANAYGFGPDRGMGWALDPNPGHSALDALINSNLNAFSLNIELFGWSVGSLLFASLFLFSSRLRRADLALLAAAATVYVAHFFYYFSGGPDFGARYWYLMIVPLVAFSARGILDLSRRGHANGGSVRTDPRFLMTAGLLCLSALAVFLPWRAIDKYRHYRGMRPDVRFLTAQHDLGRSLVLVRGEGRPDFDSAAVYNPLDLRGDAPIFAWDRNDEVRSALLQFYGDRQIWTVDGPTLTGEGYRLTGGPMTALEMQLGAPPSRQRPPSSGSER